MAPPNTMPGHWIPKTLPGGGTIKVPPDWVMPRAWAPPPPTDVIPTFPLIKPTPVPPSPIAWWLRNAWWFVGALTMDGHEGDSERQCSNIRQEFQRTRDLADQCGRALLLMSSKLTNFLGRNPPPVDPCLTAARNMLADLQGSFYDLNGLYIDVGPWANTASLLVNPSDPNSGYQVTCAQLLNPANGFVQAAASFQYEAARLRSVCKEYTRMFSTMVAQCGVSDIAVPGGLGDYLPLPDQTGQVSKKYSASPASVTDPAIDPTPKGWGALDYPANNLNGLGYTESGMATFIAQYAYTYYRVTLDPYNPWQAYNDYMATSPLGLATA